MVSNWKVSRIFSVSGTEYCNDQQKSWAHFARVIFELFETSLQGDMGTFLLWSHTDEVWTQYAGLKKYWNIGFKATPTYLL